MQTDVSLHMRLLNELKLPVHLLQVFVNLNMRHLYVVDAHNNVVGLITRKDLDHAAGHGWWRMSHQAEAPQKQENKVVLNLRNASVHFLKTLVGKSAFSALPASPQPQLQGGSHGAHGGGGGHH